jgi:pyrophosphatase PpaX
MEIDTILFDLDGTLVDTNDLIITSFSHTLEHYFPGQYTREKIIEFIGPPLIDTFKSIDENRTEELINHYRDHNLKHHDRLIKEYETVYETVERLDKEGYKLAVVTTKMRHTTTMGLAITGLDRFFDTVITINDVDKVKPDPEPLMKAMAALGSNPEQTIMVGDSQYDILGGKNAGTKTAGVCWSIKGEEYLRSLNPDYMLETMSDLLSIVGVIED